MTFLLNREQRSLKVVVLAMVDVGGARPGCFAFHLI